MKVAFGYGNFFGCAPFFKLPIGNAVGVLNAIEGVSAYGIGNGVNTAVTPFSSSVTEEASKKL